MLSVVIVNWNTRDDLQACLRSLREFPHDGPSEIIVVDNNSKDGSAAMVVAEFPEIVLISSASNLGYAAGNNAGFARAKGDFVLTLNPDVVFTRPTLGPAIAWMQQHSEVGCLAIQLIGTDGKTQSSIRGFPSLLGIIGDLTRLGQVFPKSLLNSYRLHGFDYSLSKFVPQPMGTFLMLRRSALEAVGDPAKPLDEQFPIFFNEVDLLYRMANKGWKCWYESSLTIIHKGGTSTRQVRKNMIWESHLSLIRYLRKHSPTFWMWCWIGVPIICLGAVIRAKGVSPGFRP